MIPLDKIFRTDQSIKTECKLLFPVADGKEE